MIWNIDFLIISVFHTFDGQHTEVKNETDEHKVVEIDYALQFRMDFKIKFIHMKMIAHNYSWYNTIVSLNPR